MILTPDINKPHNINGVIRLYFIAELYSRSSVAVISFPRYCRYRATLKRLEGVSDEWLRRTLVQALCGFVSYGPDTRVMFCKVSDIPFHFNLFDFISISFVILVSIIFFYKNIHLICYRKRLIIRNWKRMNCCAIIWHQN